MTITTKFEIGAEVWFMKDNKPYSQGIWSIKTEVDSSFRIKISYVFQGISSTIDECLLFSSKQELLNSL